MAPHPRKTQDNPPTTAEELLRRYASGARYFRRAELIGASLPYANLSGANLGIANLGGADLSHADLSNAGLSGANLSGANLTRARLSGANLSNADLTSAYLGGADLSEANLGNADLRQASFVGANLKAANLRDANLIGVNLRDANLTRANFLGADLTHAELTRANLTHAELTRANLRDATCRYADLSNAKLNDANLNGANISNASLNNARFDGAALGDGFLAGITLIGLCSADPPIAHYGPSVIDFESITKSLLAPNLEHFLIRAGIPAIAAQYMIESAQAVKGSVWDMMQSVFISYGGPDEAFARKLFEALHSNGVRAFFFPEHAEPGKPLHRLMRDAVREHDRVILICSKASLTYAFGHPHDSLGAPSSPFFGAGGFSWHGVLSIRRHEFYASGVVSSTNGAAAV